MGVGDKANLLELGLLHLAQEAVQRHLDAREVVHAGRYLRRVHGRALDGLLEALDLARVHDAARAQLLGAERQGVERPQAPAHAADVREDAQQAHALHDEQRGADGPQREQIPAHGKAPRGTNARRNQQAPARKTGEVVVVGQDQGRALGGHQPVVGQRGLRQVAGVSHPQGQERGEKDEQVHEGPAHQAAPPEAPCDAPGYGGALLARLGRGAPGRGHSSGRGRGGDQGGVRSL